MPDAYGTVVEGRQLSGGDIAQVRRVQTSRGLDLVVKTPPYDARLEADGLAALRRAGAPVPEVLHVTEQMLVMEYVAGPDADGGVLGETLAEVHRTVAPTFGWSRDNLIGALPQDNTPHGHWPTFYVERRIRPLLPHLPDDLRGRLDRACDGPMPDLLDHDAVPALVHGDLWSGNIVAGQWVIDPAVHHADREFELAFAVLFGGLPPRLLDAYLAASPLDEGWQRRRPALQLYHLLVHVAMFGPSWLTGVRERLDALGW